MKAEKLLRSLNQTRAEELRPAFEADFLCEFGEECRILLVRNGCGRYISPDANRLFDSWLRMNTK